MFIIINNMVQLILFENSIKNQVLRTILSLSIIIPCDILYLYLSENNINRFLNHKLAYFNVWITLAVVFGVSLIYSKIYENDKINENTIKNNVQYGLLIGLLIYVPLYNWMISCGSITNILSVANTAYGIILSAFTYLLVFIVSVQTNMI